MLMPVLQLGKYFSSLAVEIIGGWGDEAEETYGCIGRPQGLWLGLDH